MARYPGAAWHRCPGSEPSIRPTQVIFHTAVMRDLVALRNYFCSGRSGGIESHFGVGGKWGDSPAQDGAAEQWRDTDEQADANRAANRRADGTGAISIETCDNAPRSPADIEEWTPKQAARLISIGRWAHDTHGVPLRICRSPDDPGYGWHGMWDNTRFELADGTTPWTPSAGKVCPGAARIRQLKATILPAIFEGDDMFSEADRNDLEAIKAALTIEGTGAVDEGMQKLFDRVRTIEAALTFQGTATVDEGMQKLFDRVRSIEADANTIQAQLTPDANDRVPIADEVAQSLAGNSAFIDTLAQAIADKL